MGGRGIKRKSFYLLPLKIPFSAHWETSEEDAWGGREEKPYFIWSTSWSDETGKWGDFALNQAFLQDLTLFLVSHRSPSPAHLLERKSAFPGVTGDILHQHSIHPSPEGAAKQFVHSPSPSRPVHSGNLGDSGRIFPLLGQPWTLPAQPSLWVWVAVHWGRREASRQIRWPRQKCGVFSCKDWEALSHTLPHHQPKCLVRGPLETPSE